MAKRIVLGAILCLCTFTGAKISGAAQQEKPDTVFRVNVNMVQLEVAVTDKKGNYVTGLSRGTLTIYEDGITAKARHLRRGKRSPASAGRLSPAGYRWPLRIAILLPKRRTATPNGAEPIDARGTARPVASMVAGASVFILFDTSNYMYRGFVYAQDAIAEFVRSLDHPYRVAFYSYSRNFARICTLTPDRTVALGGAAKRWPGMTPRSMTPC